MTKAFSIVLKYHLTVDGGNPDGVRHEISRFALVQGEGAPKIKEELRAELIKCPPPPNCHGHSASHTHKGPSLSRIREPLARRRRERCHEGSRWLHRQAP